MIELRSKRLEVMTEKKIYKKKVGSALVWHFLIYLNGPKSVCPLQIQECHVYYCVPHWEKNKNSS